MKYSILLAVTFISMSIQVIGQNALKSYAITGKTNNAFFWADIKQVDLNTGKIIKTLFSAQESPYKVMNPDKTVSIAKLNNNNPTGMGVAACALDTRFNRLFFATLHYTEIRYLDLNKKPANFTIVPMNLNLPAFDSTFKSEENNITRMVIGADGFGYALTNDARHLIRFNTTGNPQMEDLGSLIETGNGGEISIYNKCTGWGGDMVADVFGKLVIVSAAKNIFSVDVKTRQVTYLGSISGLPDKFTTNGAAVDDEGNLVVSSANVLEGLFKVEIRKFAASKIVSKELAFNASDLANGNFLYQKEADALTRNNLIKAGFFSNVSEGSRLYPNPVTGSQFSVLFKGQPVGKYTIVLTDISGRALQTKVVSISGTNQVEYLRLTSKSARGIYQVKVLNADKKNAFIEKLIVL